MLLPNMRTRVITEEDKETYRLLIDLQISSSGRLLIFPLLLLPASSRVNQHCWIPSGLRSPAWRRRHMRRVGESSRIPSCYFRIPHTSLWLKRRNVCELLFLIWSLQAATSFFSPFASHRELPKVKVHLILEGNHIELLFKINSIIQHTPNWKNNEWRVGRFLSWTTGSLDHH